MMEPLLAHAGHWYFFPLYAAPVIVILWSAISTTLSERKEKRKLEAAESEPESREE